MTGIDDTGDPRPQSPVVAAAEWMRDILLREAAAAHRASLAELVALHEEKQAALEALAGLDPAEAAAGEDAPAARAALRAMLAAAEENGMILASVAGALESVQERLRAELAAETDPGTYSMAGGLRRRPFSLAASIDRNA